MDSLTTHPDQGWFTIKEAAEYLGISQPTLFRWMKDGQITFYKVGGATRFTRAGLDSVIEKNTGKKEARGIREKCLCCGHSELVEGHIQGNSRTYFRPVRTRFWTLFEAMVPINAKVCTACGHVQLHADTEKLIRLLPKHSASE